MPQAFIQQLILQSQSAVCRKGIILHLYVQPFLCSFTISLNLNIVFRNVLERPGRMISKPVVKWLNRNNDWKCILKRKNRINIVRLVLVSVCVCVGVTATTYFRSMEHQYPITYSHHHHLLSKGFREITAYFI